MPQSVQAKPKVQISEEVTCNLIFVIPIDPGFTKLPIFKEDNVSAMIPRDDHDHAVLHDLAAGIIRCEKVDHVVISRFRKQAKFEVQLTSRISNGTYGSIDALIRAAGCEPVRAPK